MFCRPTVLYFFSCIPEIIWVTEGCMLVSLVLKDGILHSYNHENLKDLSLTTFVVF
jgi:hypothetical protein